MNCTTCRSQMPLLYSRMGDEIDDPEFRAHLVLCPGCLQEWQEFAQLGNLLDANPEPRVAVDLVGLYRRAALLEARRGRRWRWLGMAAALLLLLGGSIALMARLELRLTRHELALRWGEPRTPIVSAIERTSPAAANALPPGKREEQIEVLSAMVRALIQELQTVDIRQRRDRADMDLRVSGLQEQTLKRWLTLQKDLEALYVLTQKGD